MGPLLRMGLPPSLPMRCLRSSQTQMLLPGKSICMYPIPTHKRSSFAMC